MSEKSNFIRIAMDEVGYLEKSRAAYNQNPDIIYDKYAGAGKDNITKYAEEMDNLNVYNTPKQGYSWCKVFVDWCLVQAVGETRATELLTTWTAGCTPAWESFAENGCIVDEPQEGDLIFFKNLAHIGIVEQVDNERVYTIEGNTSNSATLVTNGGEVARKSYKKDSSYIYGYVRLNFMTDIRDWDIYYWLYEDLRKHIGYDFYALIRHYDEFGCKEGRTASYIFDPKFYLEKYPDLQAAFGNDYAAAYMHFLEFGIPEGRQGSVIFDLQFYRNNNVDLQGMTNIELVNHFLTYGIHEFRGTSNEFNVNVYRNNNIDLQVALNTNCKEYFKHYLMFGRYEGRICN